MWVDFWSLVNFSMSSFGALQDFCPVSVQFCLSDSYLFSFVVKVLPVCAHVCIYLCILRLIAVRVYICSVFGHSLLAAFSRLSYSAYVKECPPNTCPVSVCLCLHVHMSMCAWLCVCGTLWYNPASRYPSDGGVLTLSPCAFIPL